jgi:hypothetical protein
MFDRLKSVVGRALGFGRKERARLSQMCLGDEEAVSRLITWERSRISSLSETEACRRAILRLQRDKR